MGLISTSLSLPSQLALALTGKILIRNIVFAKVVTVRFTFDEWVTVHEVNGRWEQAAYGPPSGARDTKRFEGDIFSFFIDLEGHILKIAEKRLVRGLVGVKRGVANYSFQIFCIRFYRPPVRRGFGGTTTRARIT